MVKAQLCGGGDSGPAAIDKSAQQSLQILWHFNGQTLDFLQKSRCQTYIQRHQLLRDPVLRRTRPQSGRLAAKPKREWTKVTQLSLSYVFCLAAPHRRGRVRAELTSTIYLQLHGIIDLYRVCIIYLHSHNTIYLHWNCG